MGRDEPGAVPEEARALIGATWEALAEERARAARARREAEDRIAELEKSLAAQERGGGGESEPSASQLAARLRQERDELRASVRAGHEAVREAKSQHDRLTAQLRRFERERTQAERVARELERERAARSAAQAERDEQAARLEQERAAHRATRIRAQERERERPSEPRLTDEPGKALSQLQARADERERRMRARAAEQVGRAVEQKRSMDRTLAEQSIRIQALEAANAQVTEAARRDGLARAELTAEMERLSRERDELKALARDEAHTRERLERRVAELEQSARRAAEQAAEPHRWGGSEGVHQAGRQT